ncbi:MAG: exosortase C-terminal domain/associated protein EpsI [Bryobacteraceae bacterium]|jgi:EpsI family protein
MPEFLKSTPARVVTLMLVLHAVLFYTLSHGEVVLLVRPLAEFPRQIAGWRMIQDGVIDQETLKILKADDYLTRDYVSPSSPQAVNFYVAFFRTQRTGQTPHSPKNCLPGGGWVPSVSSIVEIPIAGRPEPIRVNQYIVAKGPSRDVVMYWYQSHGRVVASEYAAKIYVVADALRYNRTDTALVRVVVPITGSDDDAVRVARDFIVSFFTPLAQFLPS